MRVLMISTIFVFAFLKPPFLRTNVGFFTQESALQRPGVFDQNFASIRAAISLFVFLQHFVRR